MVFKKKVYKQKIGTKTNAGDEETQKRCVEIWLYLYIAVIPVSAVLCIGNTFFFFHEMQQN